MGKDLYMPDNRYLAALERQKARVADGEPLCLDDSNAPGDKYTTASWGLCSDDKAAWPDAEDHLWPEDFEKRGRVAPKYLKRHQLCAFDTREKDTGDGCFHTCRLFQGRYAKPSRAEAVALYQRRIDAFLLKENDRED